MSVETRLGDEESQTRSELVTRGLHGLAHSAQLFGGRTGGDRRGHARGGPVLSEDPAQRICPLPRRDSHSRTCQGRGDEIRVRFRRGPQFRQRFVDGTGIALGAPSEHSVDSLRRHGRVDRLNRGIEIGQHGIGLGLHVLVDPDDDLLPRLHARATLGMGLHELGLHVAALDGGHRPAHRCYPVHFRACIGDELIHESFDDV